MKKFAFGAAVTLILIPLLTGCGRFKSVTAQKSAPPRTRASLPVDHSLDFADGFVANDLSHGNGAMRLAINRRWSNTDTLNTHFGRGWSDQNSIQLTLLGRNALLIWRGGVGWLTAYRKADKLFEGEDGEKIEQTKQGWIAQMPHAVTLTFDIAGRLSLRKHAAGPACNYSYDKKGWLLSLGISSDNLLKYEYDNLGRVTRVDGPEGLRLDYHYDDKGRLASVENARKVRIEYRYTDDGKLSTAKDQFGNELSVGQLRSVGHTLSGEAMNIPRLPAVAKTRYEFDTQGRLRSATDGARSKSYEYDEAGQTSVITGPEGRASCKYDAFGRIASVQNQDGTSTRFEYNNLDLPTLISAPDGRTEKIKYDEHGRLVRRERSLTDWEEFSYDKAGRIEIRRKSPAAEEQYVFGDGDRIVRLNYGNGREVDFEYDPAGRVLSESWSSGEKRVWRYDTDGRPVESVSPSGLRTTYQYDGEGRLLATDDNIHGKTSYHLVPGGDVVETARGKTTRKLTDWGKPLEIIEPGGARTAFNYNDRGLLERVLSPMNLAWRYEYNAGRKLTAIIAPSGLRTSATWDAAGRRIKVARGSVTWRESHYNSADRVEQEYSGTGRAARYIYGRDGQVAEVELPDGRVAHTTDKGGLRFARKGPGYQIEDEYNGDGALIRRNYKPAELDLRLPLDLAGRVAGIELNNLKVTYSYDARGQLVQIALPGDAAIKVVTDEAARPVELTFGSGLVQKILYDRLDRITAIEAKQTSGNAVFSERYAYDTAGNLSQRSTDSGSPVKFEYDRESRLTRASDRNVQRTFAYDVDGNLTTNGEGSARCQIDSLGRPIQHLATSYSWDAGGNLTLIQDAKGKIDDVFDAAGRLVERRDGKNTWKFGYDSGHDRLWEQSPSGKRWYAYLDERLAGFKDEAGTTWLIVSLPGTDRPLALCGSNGKTLFVLYDRLGSARRFVDASGANVASDDYTAFGNILASSGKKPIGIYAGMVRDETGLFYARRRYYDPAIARFISVDPLIGTPGNPASHNAYAYAANNPLRYRDPMGTGSFEDEIADYHQLYDYVYKKDPRDPTGNTLLRDANGDPIPETYESGPWKGEAIVDKSKPPTRVPNYSYDELTAAEQQATRQAHESAKGARQTIQDPTSSAQEVQAASEALAAYEAELARLKEIANLRAGHATMLGGERAGWGGTGSQERMLRHEQRMAELGADPFAHYSEQTQGELSAQRAEEAEAKAAAEADVAARDARAAGAFGRGSKTDQLPRAGTGQAAAADARAGTQQLPQPEPAALDAGSQSVPQGAAQSGPKTQADLAARARQQLERSFARGDAVNISKEEMDAYLAEEAEKGAPATRGTSTGTENPADLAARAREKIQRSLKTNEAINLSKEEMAAYKAEEAAKVAAQAPGTAGAASAEHPPDPAADQTLGKTAETSTTKTVPQGGAEKVPPSGRAASFGGEEEAAERWLGPKVLEAGGKLLRPLGPFLKGIEVLQTVEIAGTMAQNFIDNLNQPFVKAQMEKQGARWIGQRFANELRQLASADPDAVIMGDGHRFDPNSPKDLDELMLGLSQNLYFGRKPFDGLLKHITNKPTAFMGAAEGDTAAATALAEAWKLMQTGITAEKAANEAVKECVKQQLEAQTQLQSAVTIAAARAVGESDLSDAPETAETVKKQTAAVKIQSKSLQAAFEEMRAAIGKCDDAALKICDYAQQAPSASEEQVKAWQADATTELFGATNVLNAAQTKIDAADVSLDQLRTSMAQLEAFRTSLWLYKGAKKLGEAADTTLDDALATAQAAANKAKTAREKIGPLLEQIRAIPAQISKVLAPYLASDPEAAALNISGQSLGKDIQRPGLFDFGSLVTMASPLINAVLSNQKTVEKAIGKIDLDGIVTAAREAISAAENLRTGATSLASGPQRYASLQTASQCFAMIKFAAASTAASATATPTQEAAASPGSSDIAAAASATPVELAGASPTATPTPIELAKASTTPTTTEEDDMVEVPGIDDAKSIEYAGIILRQAGFVPVFKALKPEKKEDELKFAGSNPGAGKKAKRGSKVVVYINQKFEDTAPTTTPTAPPLGPAKDGTVPTVMGMTLEDAQTALSPAGMSVGGVDYSQTTEKADQVKKIFEQSPAAGAPIPESKAVAVRIYGGLGTKHKPPSTPSDFDQTIPGSEKELIGEYTGTLDEIAYDKSDPWGKHPYPVQRPVTITISRINDKWHFSMKTGPTSAVDSSSYPVVVDGGVLHYEQDYANHHHKVSVKVSGGQLVGTWTSRDDADRRGDVIENFRATKVK